MFCSVLRLLRSARDWIRSGTPTSPSSASTSWTLSCTSKFKLGVSIPKTENHDVDTHVLHVVRNLLDTHGDGKSKSSNASAFRRCRCALRLSSPAKTASRSRPVLSRVPRGPSIGCFQTASFVWSDRHSVSRPVTYQRAMFYLGTATRPCIRPLINTFRAMHATRAQPSWMVGGVARIRFPTPALSLPRWSTSRGFMSIVKKPEHPEDTTALQGDVLGVLLTDRAIKVRDFCLTCSRSSAR